MIWVYVGIAVVFAAFHGFRWAHANRMVQPPNSPWKAPDDAPLVSFLVPAWNAAEDILPFVTSFSELCYPHKELVVCAGGHDRSFEVAQALRRADLIVVEQHSGEGKQGALRKSFPLCRGEIIYLTDIDCRPTDEAVLPMLERLALGDIDAVNGRTCPLPWQRSSALPRALWAIERVGAPGTDEVSRGLCGANAALWRSSVVRSGAFGHDAPTGTDYTLAKELLRVGGSIALVRRSEMPTEFPKGVGAYIRKQARWLRNVFSLGLRYREGAEVKSAAITLSIPFMILLLLILGIWWRLSAFLAVLAMLHAALNRLLYGKVSGIGLGPFSSAVSFLGDAAAGLLAVFQIIRKDTSWS